MSARHNNWRELSSALLLAATVIALQWAQRDGSAKTLAHPFGQRLLPDAKGQGAASPGEIPARGWWEIIQRTIRKISDNELLSAAAGVTFYGLLAIFPALTALVSLYGLMADPKSMADHLDSVTGILPAGGIDIISTQLNQLAVSSPGKLGIGAVFGLGMAIWSANQGTKALFSALNNVYEEKEERGFIELTLQSLAFTAGAIVFVLLALLIVIILPLILGFIASQGDVKQVLAVARWPLILLSAGFFLACLYRFGPSRAMPQWRWVTWGSAFATIIWVALSIGFSWYVEHFGSYNKTYGSLGAIIGFMTWIWLSTAVMLIGAQLTAEVERQTEGEEAFAGGLR
jgi:membrane protein